MFYASMLHFSSDAREAGQLEYYCTSLVFVIKVELKTRHVPQTLLKNENQIWCAFKVIGMIYGKYVFSAKQEVNH